MLQRARSSKHVGRLLDRSANVLTRTESHRASFMHVQDKLSCCNNQVMISTRRNNQRSPQQARLRSNGHMSTRSNRVSSEVMHEETQYAEAPVYDCTGHSRSFEHKPMRSSSFFCGGVRSMSPLKNPKPQESERHVGCNPSQSRK